MTDQTSHKASPDDYERSNIAAPAEVIYRDKYASRSLALAMLAMMVLFGGLGIGALVHGEIAPALLGGTVGLLFLFVGLTRSVVRTVVTRDDVRVHWGLWGPRIPLAAITAVAPRTDCTRQALTEAMREPGSPGVHMICIPPTGRVVDLTWKDASGKLTRVWLGAGDPHALSAAIEKAAASANTTVRVAAGDSLAASDSDVVETADAAVASNQRAL